VPADSAVSYSSVKRSHCNPVYTSLDWAAKCQQVHCTPPSADYDTADVNQVMLYKLRTGLTLLKGFVRKYRLLFPIALLRTTSLQRRWKHINFSVRRSSHLCSLLQRLNNGMYSRPAKSCSPPPAATGAPCSAVPRLPHQGALAGCLSKNQRNLNLMIRDQDCRQEGRTLPIRVLWRSKRCSHSCVARSCHGEPYFGHFSCGTNSNAEGEHANFLVFQYTGKITAVSLGKKFKRTTPLSSQKTAQMLFPADSWISSYMEMSCGATPSIAAWIRAENVGSRFHLPWNFATGSLHFLYRIGAKGQR